MNKSQIIALNSENNARFILTNWLANGVMPFEYHEKFDMFVSLSHPKDTKAMAFIQDFISIAAEMDLEVVFHENGDSIEILTADDRQRQHYEDLAAQFGYEDAA